MNFSSSNDAGSLQLHFRLQNNTAKKFQNKKFLKNFKKLINPVVVLFLAYQTGALYVLESLKVRASFPIK